MTQTKGGNIMRMGHNLAKSLAAVVTLLGLIVDPGGGAQAQAPAAGPVQPWGLPPLPAGGGPVEKFADVSGTPQGQFLEGGSVDTQVKSMFRSDRQRLGV